ncbi:MAG: molybdopterin-synthase adenylyltransferase MoeB [Aliidiomarina sp.]|uniref:HesA/MoeB/ThiF family protein n=1 Tax=Aliidiomarina sp. TaxID=1872439 RepID=UPI0025C60BF7|nr:molybdopterin-synthase adenylyltransferase MoeB [Aliidiomarina sp.]MCH8501133.1 molybdopterin-synthase adenylyltransferase MoeB [Aliidiomarina sp.]
MSKPTQPMSDQQALRYSRHVMLPTVDFTGQERILAARVAIVGMGGLGCAVAPYLAGSGVGELILIDNDRIERSNLQRQILFREHNIGDSKAETAAATLRALNSEVKIQAISERLTRDNLEAVLVNSDVIVDCCDNLETRNLLNAFCWQQQIPLVSGAAIRFEGQVAVYPMTEDTPCYRCFSRLFGEQQLTCMEAGVFSPVVGVVGALQAVETLKLIAHVGETLSGAVLLYDGAHASWQRINLPKSPDCSVCANPRD